MTQVQSEYERKRLAQIQANEDFLANLDLSQDRKALAPKPKSRAAKGQPRKRVKVEVNAPPRRSSRVRGEAPDPLYIVSTSRGQVKVGAMPVSMSIGASEQDIEKAVSLLQSEREPTRFEEQTLDLGLDSEAMGASGQSFFKHLQGSVSSDDNAEVQSQPTPDSLAYSKKLAGLECVTAVKFSPSRIYSVGFHPHTATLITGDRDGNLAMANFDTEGGTPDDADADADANADPDIVSFQPHKSTINNIHVTDSVVTTFSYDGQVRRMDFAKPGIFERAFETEDLDRDVWLQYGVVFGEAENKVIVGLSSGMVVSRALNAPKDSWKFEAHEKKVQTVSATKDERYLATASLDRSIKIWDLRKVGSSRTKPLNTFQDSHSINSCFWNAEGTKMISCAMSNKLHYFEHPQNTASEELSPTSSITHDNRTGRYLAVFHAVWDPRNTNAFICGSMAKPRRVEVFDTSTSSIKLAMNLAGDELASVQSRNAFHPNRDMIACANASGRIHLYR